MLTSSQSLRQLPTSNKIQLLLSVLWRCLVVMLILWIINPYLRLLSVLIHSIPVCWGWGWRGLKPAANQNVSQPFTEQCKLHNFWFALKSFPSVSKLSVCCSELFLRRGLGSAFLCFTLPCFSFFLCSGESMRVCDFIREVKLQRINCNSMWLFACVFGDISVMRSAYIQCVFLMKKVTVTYVRVQTTGACV